MQEKRLLPGMDEFHQTLIPWKDNLPDIPGRQQRIHLIPQVVTKADHTVDIAELPEEALPYPAADLVNPAEQVFIQLTVVH